jgi:hypothetical protein
MKISELKNIVQETILSINEAELGSDELSQIIDRFAELSDEIDRLKATLKTHEAEYRKYNDILAPLVEELQQTKQQSITTAKYLITIKKAGYTYNRVGYQEAFDTLYNKVNPALKRIADDIKKANTTVVTVASKIGVQKNITEVNILNTLRDKFITFISSLTNRIDKNNDKIESAIQEFKLSLKNKSKK